MGILSHIEKQKLERLLGMQSGYVLNFTNREFEDFFREIVGVEIYSENFNLQSGSKANRLRSFWEHGSKSEIIKSLKGLLEAWDLYSEKEPIDQAQKTIFPMLDRLENKQKKQKSAIVSASLKLNAQKAKSLLDQFLKITQLEPRPRGFEFEKFLKELFDAYGMEGHKSFRITGEQIDGSFVLHNETYLLEAKWHADPTPAKDLRDFEGKLSEKAAWARGLFISINGFSSDGLISFGRNKKQICMDGLDLSQILLKDISLLDILDAKTRQAAETGSPYIPFDKLRL
jgi:hypothetical protein